MHFSFLTVGAMLATAAHAHVLGSMSLPRGLSFIECYTVSERHGYMLFDLYAGSKEFLY